MTIEERHPTRAAMNAIERIRRITSTTKTIAETPHAADLLEAVQEQVEDELAIIERVLTRFAS